MGLAAFGDFLSRALLVGRSNESDLDQLMIVEGLVDSLDQGLGETPFSHLHESLAGVGKPRRYFRCEPVKGFKAQSRPVESMGRLLSGDVGESGEPTFPCISGSRFDFDQFDDKGQCRSTGNHGRCASISVGNLGRADEF